MQHHHDDNDEEDEPTLDIMTDFKKNAGIISSPAAGQGGEEAWSFLQQSRHASFLEPSLSAVKKNRHDESELRPTDSQDVLSPLLEASVNFGLPTPGGRPDDVSMTERPSLDVTAAPPSLNLTEANTAEISR